MLSPEWVREIMESRATTKVQKWVNLPRLSSVHEVFTLEGAGCRRGLVVEVAPGVVDASAVALPSSHVIPDVAESDVPELDPLDSDEEDELDAFSRNATGATQVDRDLEPTVSVGRG